MHAGYGDVYEKWLKVLNGTLQMHLQIERRRTIKPILHYLASRGIKVLPVSGRYRLIYLSQQPAYARLVHQLTY